MNKDTHLSLYRFDGCPWCERVRAAIADLELDIEERDVRANREHAGALQEALGRGTVPVLRTDSVDGTEWLAESKDIVTHLYSVHGDDRKPTFLATNLPQQLGSGIGLVLLLVSFFTEGSNQTWMLAAAFGFWILGNRAPFLWRFF